jgi:hypothetical protein
VLTVSSTGESSPAFDTTHTDGREAMQDPGVGVGIGVGVGVGEGVVGHRLRFAERHPANVAPVNEVSKSVPKQAEIEAGDTNALRADWHPTVSTTSRTGESKPEAGATQIGGRAAMHNGDAGVAEGLGTGEGVVEHKGKLRVKH